MLSLTLDLGSLELAHIWMSKESAKIWNNLFFSEKLSGAFEGQNNKT